MSIQEIIPYIIIGITGFISYKGFNDRNFFNEYLFHVGKIRQQKDYKRLVTSGFLHADWNHLFFNMLSLYFFSSTVLYFSGISGYLTVYAGALIGGSLFSLFINKNNPNYSAIGASGAVSGVIFAAIALNEDASIRFFFIPIDIPGWVYALGYTVYSILGIKNKTDNIGHEAHLGGGVAGMLIAFAFRPNLVINNYIPVLLVLVPTVIFVVILSKFPHLLNKNTWAGSKLSSPTDTVDEEYNAIKREKEEEVNRILEKVSSQGVGSLSRDEKNFLDLNT